MKKRLMSAMISMGMMISLLAGCRNEDAQENNSNLEHDTEYTEGETQKLTLSASIAPVLDDCAAAVTIISDDGFYETGVNLNNLAIKYDMKITVAGAISIVSENLSGWKEIVDQGHIELVNHSYDHIKMDEDSEISKDEDALYHQIVDADKWFEDNFGTEQFVFVCPENIMCNMGYDILENNGFYAVRKGHRGYNMLSPLEGRDDFEWYSLGVQGIRDVTTTQERNAKIDYAIANKSWLIEMWHSVTDEDIGHYQWIPTEEADAHLYYIAYQRDDGNIWVASFNDAVKYFREKENSCVNAILENDKILLEVTYDKNILPESIFDFPLTIKVQLPKENGMYLKNYYYNDILCKKTIDDNGNWYLLVNCVPNQGIVTIEFE